MEEDALTDAWNLSLANGFKGGKKDFTKLLQSNSDFFNLSFFCKRLHYIKIEIIISYNTTKCLK